MKRDRLDPHHIKLVRQLSARKHKLPAKERGEVSALEVYWEMNRSIPREAIMRIRDLLTQTYAKQPLPEALRWR